MTNWSARSKLALGDRARPEVEAVTGGSFGPWQSSPGGAPLGSCVQSSVTSWTTRSKLTLGDRVRPEVVAAKGGKRRPWLCSPGGAPLGTCVQSSVTIWTTRSKLTLGDRVRPEVVAVTGGKRRPWLCSPGGAPLGTCVQSSVTSWTTRSKLTLGDRVRPEVVAVTGGRCTQSCTTLTCCTIHTGCNIQTGCTASHTLTIGQELLKAGSSALIVRNKLVETGSAESGWRVASAWGNEPVRRSSPLWWSKATWSVAWAAPRRATSTSSCKYRIRRQPPGQLSSGHACHRPSALL